MLAISLTIACSRYTYSGAILHAHPVRGESHNQRNTTGEFATLHLTTPNRQRLSSNQNTKQHLTKKLNYRTNFENSV